jgi:Spy/CpxP family protein refolding chaperone
MRTLVLRCALTVTAVVAGMARAGAPQTDQAITDLQEHHRHHQHGGITQFVELSLDTLGADEAHQDQVERLQDALHDCMDPVEAEEERVLRLIADGVAAGAVDAAKVKAGIEQVDTAANTIHACVAGPLNELHKALAPHERAELGEKVRAHWTVWRQANHDEDPAQRAPGSRLAELSKELTLAPDQVEQMSAALKAAFSGRSFDAERVSKQVQAFATAFVGSTFDATTVTTNSTAYLTSHGMTRMGLFYQTIAPLLNPAQRVTLAAHLREHATHHNAAAAP